MHPAVNATAVVQPLMQADCAWLQGFLSSTNRSTSACALKFSAEAWCFMHWAYATSSTQFPVDLKTLTMPDHPQAACRDGSQAACNSSQSTPVCADVACADVARADVVTDRSDQSGASSSGDHTQDRPHSGSRRKRDASGSSVSPEKHRGTGGFLHGAAGNPQSLLGLCCTCAVGLTWCCTLLLCGRSC